MRLLLLHHDPDGGLGGATHMAWRTADALAARGHDVALAATPPARARPEGRATWLGAELPRSVGEAAGAAGWVPDVVHVTDLADPEGARRGRALADGAGALFALTPATDAALWREPEVAGGLLRQADVVFGLTPAERAALEGLGVPPVRLAPLAQGPQLGGTADPAGFRARVGARGPLVLFLGRKIPSKGYQHLIAAAPEVFARHPTATIVVAGPEPPSSPGSGPGGVVLPRLQKPCQAVAARDERLRQLPALDESAKHSALRAADVVVLPSVADAFPLVFVEAWTCGVPVVSGPFPGAHDVVRHGIDGLVVDADPAAVAQAVGDLLADPSRRRAMGAAGRQRAAAELSWDAVAADAERGYREAARTLVATSPATSPAMSPASPRET